MAPSKRKAEDDFILTLSVYKDVLDQEDLDPPLHEKTKKPTESVKSLQRHPPRPTPMPTPYAETMGAMVRWTRTSLPRIF